MKNEKNKLQIAIPLIVAAIIAIGYIFSQPIGTLSAIGWKEISALCPLGALADMLASKTLVPRVVIALILAVVAIVILGRAFCSWVCPVPIVSKLRGAFASKQKHDQMLKDEAAKRKEGRAELALSPEELKMLEGCKRGCGTLASKKNVDSRHLVLAGVLLSTAIFGFPVFCLVCPIGLTFATIFLLYNLFAFADLTWTVIAVPALLLVEVVFFRKWCSHVCPISALMSLIGKGNRTFEPTIDTSKCHETTRGISCGICEKVCPQHIDHQHPERSNNWAECTKCRKCVDACPAGAITMPFLPKNGTNSAPALTERTAETKE